MSGEGQNRVEQEEQEGGGRREEGGGRKQEGGRREDEDEHEHEGEDDGQEELEEEFVLWCCVLQVAQADLADRAAGMQAMPKTPPLPPGTAAPKTPPLPPRSAPSKPGDLIRGLLREPPLVQEEDPPLEQQLAPEQESSHDSGSEEDLWACHPSPSPAHAYNTHMSACMRLCVLACQDSFISGGPFDVVVELTYLRVYMCIYIHMCPGSPCFQEGLQGVYMYIKGLLQFRRSCKCRWRL